MQSTNKPHVSICIPVYNGAKYIEAALESIRNQSYSNFDCHVVNNASKDNTAEIGRKFEDLDKRFHLHDCKEFVDMVPNWNRTVQYISPESKYFKLVQADDIIFPESLSTMVELMEKYPSAGIGSSYRLVGKRTVGHGVDYLEGNFHKGRKILLAHLKEEMEVTGSITQLFFRVETLKTLHFFPEIFISGDLHFDARLAYELYLISDFVFAFSILNYTRRHEAAGTVTTVEKFNTLLHAKEVRLRRFISEFPELSNLHKLVRRKYAYFIFKKKLKRDEKCLAWHEKHSMPNFSMGDYIKALMFENNAAMKIKNRINIILPNL